MVVSAGVQFDVTVCLVSDILCVGGLWLECVVEIGSGVDCRDRLHIMTRNEVTVVCVQMSLPALMHACSVSFKLTGSGVAGVGPRVHGTPQSLSGYPQGPNSLRTNILNTQTITSPVRRLSPRARLMIIIQSCN